MARARQALARSLGHVLNGDMKRVDYSFQELRRSGGVGQQHEATHSNPPGTGVCKFQTPAAPQVVRKKAPKEAGSRALSSARLSVTKERSTGQHSVDITSIGRFQVAGIMMTQPTASQQPNRPPSSTRIRLMTAPTVRPTASSTASYLSWQTSGLQQRSGRRRNNRRRTDSLSSPVNTGLNRP